MAKWTHLDSENLYNVQKWGQGFFHVNEQGNVEVRPEGADRPNRPGIDLHELLGQLLRRGVSTPILVRFDGILRARVRSEEHTSELQSHSDIVCRLLLEKRKTDSYQQLLTEL